ncbi:MAG: L-rhamnose-proton symporter [Sodalis sp.]|nr:MAG: L-rhamnose-proton symporter [Sodalis sp.]
MGIDIVIGITLIVGTLLILLIQGKCGILLNTTDGWITLVWVLVAVIGVGIVSYAGPLKTGTEEPDERMHLKRTISRSFAASF